VYKDLYVCLSSQSCIKLFIKIVVLIDVYCLEFINPSFICQATQIFIKLLAQ